MKAEGLGADTAGSKFSGAELLPGVGFSRGVDSRLAALAPVHCALVVQVLVQELLGTWIAAIEEASVSEDG